MDERRRRQMAAIPSREGREPRQWYSIRAEASSDTTEIMIYDVIDPWWGVSADQFVRDLAQVDTPNLTVRINSPGGDIFDAWAIYQAIRNHPAYVTTQIDALAASSASVVAMAGNRIVMAKPSDMMIHKAWTIMLGNGDELRSEANLLDKLDGQIAGVYADRAGGTVDEWLARMADETWFTQDEAVELGLADEVMGSPSASTQDRYDHSILNIFRNTPARLMRRQQIDRDLTERGAERALRDAGASREQAKAIIAKGWHTEARDASEDVAPRLLAGLRELTRAS